MHHGEWQQALTLLLTFRVEDGFELSRRYLWCSRVLCELGRYSEAVEQAKQSANFAPGTSQSIARYRGLLIARATRRIAYGQVSTAIIWQLLKEDPASKTLQIQFAEQALKTFGDWRPAHQLFLNRGEDAKLSTKLEYWMDIRSRIYEGCTRKDNQLVKMRGFAEKFLTLPGIVGTPERSEQTEVQLSNRGRRTRRIGVISNLFCSGPVFYMGIGALTRLANASKLVLFSRQSIDDWATDQFRRIADEWMDVSHLNPQQLEKKIRSAELDILVDMAGLMDLDVLKALSSKPSRKQYKWVGGQFSTTGLHCFDGFITDEVQSPRGSEQFHTEKLVRLKSGYVTYTVPPYIPKPEKPVEKEALVVGVISHPIKVVNVFLEFLKKEILNHQSQSDFKVELNFIGGRYGSPVVQKRIHQFLFPSIDQAESNVLIRFLPTTGHKNQLLAVRGLDWVIDTFPFTGGLTTLEALALGVPVRTYAGKTFQERHGVGHCAYSGLRVAEYDLQKIGPFGQEGPKNDGTALLKAGSQRLNHDLMAESLEELFMFGTSGVEVT